MKKVLTMFLIILLCVSAFSGCDNVLPQNGGSQTTDDTLNTNAECAHNWILISSSEEKYECAECKETHLCVNAEDLEKAGRLNESTLIYKCRICGSEHLTTDPDSINPDCEHDWERISNYNESTVRDRCTICGETRLYTDPDSIDKPSDQQVAAPVDFAIHFETWIDGSQRNILDTYEGYIQKDLISDGTSKKDYNPSYVELCQLYQFVLALEHRTELDYSKPVTYDNYADDEISVSMDPLTCYYLKFTANGKTIEISGDATANECTDQSEEALLFVDAIRGIGNFYRNTDVYKTMPNANGAYE